MKNVKYGKCVRCGRTYEAKPDLTNCECGGILDIVYDYDYIKTVLTKEKLARRENRSMWRYRELLPVEETTPDTPLDVWPFIRKKSGRGWKSASAPCPCPKNTSTKWM